MMIIRNVSKPLLNVFWFLTLCRMESYSQKWLKSYGKFNKVTKRKHHITSHAPLSCLVINHNMQAILNNGTDSCHLQKASIPQEVSINRLWIYEKGGVIGHPNPATIATIQRHTDNDSPNNYLIHQIISRLNNICQQWCNSQ